MTNKARKHTWSVPLMMSIAIIGVLATLLVLANNPGAVMAQGGDPCAGMTSEERAQHILDGGTCGDQNGNGNGNGNGMMGDAMHASMPGAFWLEGLDNGARLSWEMPTTVANNAMIVSYKIDRDAWNPMDGHPINMNGDATITAAAHKTDHSDLGLAYATTYTYMVRAVVQYNVEGWWDMLNCVEMNDAVSPRSDEPAVGADTDGTTYCQMYDNLSSEAMVVVQRAYAGLDRMDYTYYGEWSMPRSVTTADSGGRLAALLDPPSMVQGLAATAACDNMVTVTWRAPADFGSVPEVDENGVYVGPDYIGGSRTGKEEVGEDATSVTYQVLRMVNNGAWASVTHVGNTYTDSSVMYGNTYKYVVRAMNGAGLYGPWTRVMEELTRPAEPRMPRSLNVDPVGGTVELQWDPPVDDASLWRTQADFELPGNESSSLQYIIDRKVGAGNWQRIATRYHEYADNYEDTLTQAFTDETPPVGLVSYRVAALVHGCNPSPFNQKDPVDVVQQPLGSATGLSAMVGATAGTVQLTWTAGTSSTRHWLAGIKSSDWAAGNFSNVIWRATTGQSSDTVSGLSSGEEYAFTVLSGDANGWDRTWAPIQRATPN